MNGILLAEDKDYKTAYSYFYEAFEAFHSLEEGGSKALLSLKYMMLVKVMSSHTEDVLSLYSGKYGLRYTGRHLDAMRQVAMASRDKSLMAFQKALDDFSVELHQDPVVS